MTAGGSPGPGPGRTLSSAGWWVVLFLAAVSAFVAFAFGSTALADGSVHRLAVRLADRGVRRDAVDVRLRLVRHGGPGPDIDWVQVRFADGAGPGEVRLTEVDPHEAGRYDREGVQPPRPGSPYAPPVQVLVDPSTGEAMSAADVQRYRADRLWVSSAWIAAGAVLLLAATVTLLVRRSARGRRARRAAAPS